MLRPWSFELILLEDSTSSIHHQLTRSIIAYIKNGYLAPHSALPGTRALSEKLSINRKTVIRAYEALIDNGWLYSEHKRGTFVSPFIPIQHNEITDINFSALSNRQYIPKNSANKFNDEHWIYLDRFQIDHSIVDFAVFSRAIRHAMISSIRKLNNIENRSNPIINTVLIKMLNSEQNLQLRMENLLVLQNSSSAIYFTTKTLLKEDDFVLLEVNADHSIKKLFDDITKNIITVKHDESGININDLEKLCINFKIKILYLTPNSQAITGACLSIENRKQLVLMAEKYQFYIIEDESQSGLSLAKVPTPLSNMSNQKMVVYINCMLEGISTLLNLAFMVADKYIIDSIARRTTFLKDNNSEILEFAITELLNNGELKRQSCKAVETISERKNHFIQLISNRLKGFVYVLDTKYGRKLTLICEHNIDVIRLKNDAKKVNLVLNTYEIEQKSGYQCYINLYYYHLNLDQQINIVDILKSLIVSQLKTSPTVQPHIG